MKYSVISILAILFLSPSLFAGTAHGGGSAGKQTIYTATVDKDGIQKVEISGSDYYFDPDHIVVKKDIPVEFTVRKMSGIIPHNIVIESPEASMNIRETISRDPRVIRFTPTKTGTYPFFCDKKFLFFPSHRKKGMEGILEVVE
ncbi:MAG: quinol oxidase [Nitrospiraceae bacterium]|nr:MAG: quinol oxidase [Nitrospiraceae bacterium]